MILKDKKKNEPKNKIISIKSKILGMIIPVVIIMVIALVTISYGISSRSLEKVSNNLLSSSINNQYHQIKAWLDENLESFEMIKTMIEGTNPNDEELQLILDQYSNYNSNYENGIYIGDSDGNLIVGKGSAKTENDVINSVWFKEGMTRVSMDYGQEYLNSDGKNVISATGIINDNSGVKRVIAADITLDRINIIVNSNVEMNDAQSFLVNLNDDTILSHRENELVSTNINSHSENSFLSKIAKKIKEKDYDDAIIEEYNCTFKKIDDTNWLLVSYIPTKTILKEITLVRNIMIAVSLVCLISLIIIIERTVHVTIKPVEKLTEVITTMSSGDFRVEIQEKGNNEITLMSKSVNNLVSSMDGMIKNMSTISQNLNLKAESSNRISEEMNESSKTQSSSMNELNIIVGELVSSTEEIANSATELAAFVSNTREESENVKVKMEETVFVSERGKIDMENIGSEINIISSSIQELKEGINEVGNASEEITSIVKLIGNIAEETNLLSLNASIEAARAGEAGKGFAIVASEIGNLATTSTNAVNDISELILNIKLLVDKVVNATSVSIEKINGSSKHIVDALNTFNKIYNNIQDTNVLIQGMVSKVSKVDSVASNVASISEEQAASAEMILNTSEVMVTQANNITRYSEEVANDAKEIALSSNELDKQIQLFKVK